MPEAAIGTPERVASTVVTSENLDAFIQKRLDLAQPEAKEPPKEAPKPEAKAEAKPEAKSAEPPAPEAELDAVIEEAKAPNPAEEKKQRFRERMSELAAKRKEAEAKAASEAERAAKAERELAEERARKPAPEPAPAPAEAKAPEAPTREKYPTDDAYQAALIDYRVEVKLGTERRAAEEARAKAAQERELQTYGQRLAAVKAEIPDYDARIERQKNLSIPPHIQEVLIESEHGPRLALYFADHPEEHARILALRPSAAVRELGKIETMFEAKPEKKDAPAAPKKPDVEVSKAPPPIEPVQGRSAVSDVKVDSEGRFSGTYAEFKALRKAGKLK